MFEKKKLIVLFLVLSLWILHAQMVYALEDYPITAWNADDMEVGSTIGINGLEFIQPTDTTTTLVKVTDCGRNNDVGSYSNAIKTGGSAGELINYVPQKRAVKFTVTKPCDINIYAYSASTGINIDMKLSRSGKLVDTFELINGDLKLYKAYLDSAGTYYIYSTKGSAAICEIKVGNVRGDLDYDFDVDWNDLRLARKAVNRNDYRDEHIRTKLDLNNDGSINNADIADLEANINDISKAEFVNSICWNASNMSTGFPEVYNGLEFVDKDCDTTNNSIVVYNINKEYTGTNGNTRTYTKCIATDGYLSRGKLNYPVTKAVKFNLEADSHITIYMSTGSSTNKQHKAQIINADNVVVQEFDLTTNVEKYTVELTGDETYFIGSPTGTIRIYEIYCTADVSRTINVNAGKVYSYILTGDSIPNTSESTYIIKYNSSAVTLKSLGEGASDGTSFTTGNNIQIISHENGILKFKYTKTATDWTGVLTVFKFTANSSGTTTITFGMEA